MLGQRFQIKAFDIFRKNFSFQVPCSRCLYSGCSREILHNILILFAKSQSFFHEIISYFVKCFTLHPTFRNLRCSIRKTVLKNLPIFTGKQLCWNLFLIKLIKKRLQHMCFLVNIAKFLLTPFCRTSANGCFFISFVECYACRC